MHNSDVFKTLFELNWDAKGQMYDNDWITGVNLAFDTDHCLFFTAV